MTNRALLIVVFVIFPAACSVERAPLVASDVVVTRPHPGTMMSAGYFTLRNDTEQGITITRVTSPQFGSVAMHQTVLEDGVARMYPLGELTIPAGETVTFEPGGKHLMLMRPADEIQTVTLEFHAGPSVLLAVNVMLSD